MVDIKTIIRGIQVLFYEPNVMLLLEKEGKNPGEIETREKKAMLGKVVAVDLVKNTIIVRALRDEIRSFHPSELWLLPQEMSEKIAVV
ncbi:MAG: hypothetical protein ABH841_01290 [Candidatus Nealsonbacteria bacterium]